jgi:hypothetical protein
VRGRVPFIPPEAKGGGLDQCQVFKQELEHISLREGRPTRVWVREKRIGEVEAWEWLAIPPKGAHYARKEDPRAKFSKWLGFWSVGTTHHQEGAHQKILG